MATPTAYGKRLIPQILDEVASTEPDRILYSVAVSSDISQGFQHLTARIFAKAVDKTAWMLRSKIEESPTIQSALFLSPKNSTEAALAVLDAASCNIWVKPGGKPSKLVDEFLHQRPMKVIELPGLDELLDAEAAEPYPYTKTFDQAIRDPFCLLHTSGSTGLPKPIGWSHGLIGTMDAVRLLPPTDGDGGMMPWTSGWNDGDRIYSSFPMSHVGVNSPDRLDEYITF
ncbi:unnamed protein product [Sphagnum balticum]